MACIVNRNSFAFFELYVISFFINSQSLEHRMPHAAIFSNLGKLNIANQYWIYPGDIGASLMGTSSGDVLRMMFFKFYVKFFQAFIGKPRAYISDRHKLTSFFDG